MSNINTCSICGKETIIYYSIYFGSSKMCCVDCWNSMDEYKNPKKMICENCKKTFEHLYKVYPSNHLIYKDKYYFLCGVCTNLVPGKKIKINKENNWRLDDGNM